MVKSSNVTKEQIFSLDWERALTPDIVTRLETASRLLGEINQVTSNIFEFEFIVEALKNIEALNSAKIEGTTGNLEDLYNHEQLDDDHKKVLKLFAAVNYKHAITDLEGILANHPKIDLAVIRHLHQSLASNDPSTSGQPGSLRNKDVKIRNTALGDFYPPSHVVVKEYLEQLVGGENLRGMPALIACAIRHYQFECIHPFEDGNGRTGRIMIIAELVLRGMLRAPVINLSQYFEEHREEYVSRLRAVSDKGELREWIIFFLEGIIVQCKKNITLIEQMRNQKDHEEALIRAAMRSSQSAIIIHALAWNNLYITTPQAEEELKKHRIPLRDYYQVAHANINHLVRLNILKFSMTRKDKIKVYEHIGLRRVISS